MALGKFSTCGDVISALRSISPQPFYISNATTIITGANAGIGKKTAQEIAYLGGKVILAVRNIEKGKAAIEFIKKKAPASLRDVKLDLAVVECDLSSLTSVKAFAEEYLRKSETENWPPLKCLILNAGLVALKGMVHTKEGLEQTFGVNHLGHFYLTKLLLPKLQADKPSRVVVVSSTSHKGKKEVDFAEKDQVMQHVVNPSKAKFSMMSAYGYSKLCNVLFAQELYSREAENGISTCSLHPGDLIATDIARENWMFNWFIKYVYRWFTKSVDQGASTTVYCALLPHEELGGNYFDNCAKSRPGREARGEKGETSGKVLWELSENLLAKTAKL